MKSIEATRATGNTKPDKLPDDAFTGAVSAGSICGVLGTGRVIPVAHVRGVQVKDLRDKIRG